MEPKRTRPKPPLSFTPLKETKRPRLQAAKAKRTRPWRIRVKGPVSSWIIMHKTYASRENAQCGVACLEEEWRSLGLSILPLRVVKVEDGRRPS